MSYFWNQNQKPIFMNKVRRIIKLLGVTIEELRSENRTRRVADARSMLAALLPATQEQVASFLGCTQPAVHKMRRRHTILLQNDYVYQRKWKEVFSVARS